MAWLTQPTRSRILDAAEHHFAADGFTASGVDQIAATAGVSKSHLYYHFESKARLLECLIELRTAQLLAEKDRLFREPVADLFAQPERLVGLTSSILTELLVPNRAFIRMVLVESIRNPGVARPVIAAIDAVLDDSLSRFGAIGRPVDPVRARRWLFFFGVLPALYAVAADEALGLPGGLADLAGDLAALEIALIPGLFEEGR